MRLAAFEHAADLFARAARFSKKHPEMTSDQVLNHVLVTGRYSRGDLQDVWASSKVVEAILRDHPQVAQGRKIIETLEAQLEQQ